MIFIFIDAREKIQKRIAISPQTGWVVTGSRFVQNDRFPDSHTFCGTINMSQQLSHNVFFTLKDKSTEKIDGLVQACHKYLKDHPGVVFFAAGTLVDELQRPVNDRDFQVALHVVFADKTAHDAYQTVEDHLTFIAENKENWETVRVFDSYVTS